MCNYIDVGAHMCLDAALACRFFTDPADVKSIKEKKNPRSENINREEF